MRVATVNMQDNEGGAGRAAYRLHCGLRAVGVDSRMLVMQRSAANPDPTVSAAPAIANDLTGAFLARLDRVPLRLYPGRPVVPYSLNWFPNLTRRRVGVMQPDLVHLHWIGSGFVPVRDVARLGVPAVWTLHDMWAFTGGCHSTEDCTRYRARCGACPQLASRAGRDVSRWTWRRKRRHWAGADLTLVTPSRWLAACVRESSLFRNAPVEVIPNGIDVTVYRPHDRAAARRLLGLPEEKKLVLFGAAGGIDNPRKGFRYLQGALQRLAGGAASGIELVILGAERPSVEPYVGCPVTYLGALQDDLSLSLLYSAVDVLAAPFMQDNLPNTVMEAHACGTPAVAFDAGGLPDLIEHERSGYLARPFEADDLAAGIAWVLGDETRWQALSQRARAKVEVEFRLEDVARRYAALYEDVLRARGLTPPGQSSGLPTA